jgi:hypothetical protein
MRTKKNKPPKNTHKAQNSNTDDAQTPKQNQQKPEKKTQSNTQRNPTELLTSSTPTNSGITE